MRKKNIVFLSSILLSTSGGHDAGREDDMVRACKVEEHRCPSRRCGRLVVISMRGRGRLGKSWGGD